MYTLELFSLTTPADVFAGHFSLYCKLLQGRDRLLDWWGTWYSVGTAEIEWAK